jgi:acyl-coenzyme A synthetase/AMP-(fatty) acid ligase
VNKVTENMAVIDKNSGEIAILLVGEGETAKVVYSGNLPDGAVEGDWVRITEDGEFEIMQRFTGDRKKTVRSKLDMLRQNNP